MYTIYILILIVSNSCESDSISICDAGMYKAPPALTDNVCGAFAVYGVSGITVGAGIHINNGGDMGVYPGSSITGVLVFKDGGIITKNTSYFASSVVANQATMADVREDGHNIAAEIGGLIFYT